MKKVIYLCGPINGRTTADCRDWRDEVKRLWGEDTLVPWLVHHTDKVTSSVTEALDFIREAYPQ